MPFTFKVGESIKKAWMLYKENFGQMFLFVFVLFFAQIINSFLSGKEGNFIVSLIFFFVNTFILYIGIKSILSLIDGKGFHPFSNDSLPSLSMFWQFLKTYLLLIVCVLPVMFIPIFMVIFIGGASYLFIATLPIYILPFVLIAIIPGIYVASRLFPAIYLSIEKSSEGAVKNISEAWNLTKGNGWNIFGKTILIGLFAIVGIFALFVGIIVTYPISMIVIVMMYRELIKNNQSPEVVSVAEVLVTPVKEEAKPETKEEEKISDNKSVETA